MQSNPEYHSSIHPMLTSFTDECCATLARLIGYVGALTLFGIVGLHFWNQLQFEAATEPVDQPGFALATRSHPAFAVSSLDPSEKSETYDIFRHPAGGRKDIFHWGPPGEKPVALGVRPTASSRRPPISRRAWHPRNPENLRLQG
jgi:hypothetical protein